MSCANIMARMPLPHRLARGRLALAGHQAVAHQDFVDGVAGHAGALDCGLDRGGAKLPGGEAREVAEQASDRGAGGGNDDDAVGGHGELLAIKWVKCKAALCAVRGRRI
jgi:hypothetical protein